MTAPGLGVAAAVLLKAALAAAGLLAALVAALAALHVLAPATSNMLRRRFFARLMTNLNRGERAKFAELRGGLVAEASGTVVEIGPGPGSNFPHFRPGTIKRWIGVEPNAHFDSVLRARAREAGSDFELEVVRGSAEDMSTVPDGAADYVISTHVLCSVGDTGGVLDEIARVLKPGGTFLYLEHCSAEAGTLKERVQRFITPVWRYVGDGCEFRPLWRDLSGTRGPLTFETSRIEAPIGTTIATPHVIGRAVKA